MKSENKINTLPVLIIFINPFCRNMKLKLIDFGSGAFYQSGPFTDFDGKLHFIPAYCTSVPSICSCVSGPLLNSFETDVSVYSF